MTPFCNLFMGRPSYIKHVLHIAHKHKICCTWNFSHIECNQQYSTIIDHMSQVLSSYVTKINRRQTDW